MTIEEITDNLVQTKVGELSTLLDICDTFAKGENTAKHGQFAFLKESLDVRVKILDRALPIKSEVKNSGEVFIIKRGEGESGYKALSSSQGSMASNSGQS